MNLPKLKEAMVNQNYHHTSKPVFDFIDQLAQQTKTIDFNQYLLTMTQNLDQLNQGQLIAEMLDEQGKGEITKENIK